MRILCLLFCLGFGFALQAQAPSQPAPSLDEAWYGENQGLPLLEAMKRPQVGAESRKLKNWNWQQGNATYTLSGQATLLLVQDQTIGFYFRGEGKVRYTSHEPKEFATLKRLVDYYTNVKPQESPHSITLEAPLKEGIFWFAGMSAPELPGEATPSDPKACLSRISNILDIDQTPFIHELALRSLKSTTQPYFRAQLLCWNYAWLHMVDPLDSESLQFSSVSHRRGNTWTLCSQQPMGWTYARPKSPRFALTHLDAQVEVSQSPKGRAVFTQTFLPKIEGLTALDLRLRNTLPGSSKILAQDIQRIRVRRVLDEQGNALPFDHANEGLLIQIPGLQANVPVVVKIEVDGELLDLNYENPDRLRTYDWRLTGPWFPLPKDLAAEVYTVHATVKTPPYMAPMMGGQILREEVKDGWRTLETRLDQPVQNFGILTCGNAYEKETRDGVTLRIAGRTEDAKLHRLILDQAWAVLQGFQHMFGGTLPFKDFYLVVNTWYDEELPGILSIQFASQNSYRQTYVSRSSSAVQIESSGGFTEQLVPGGDYAEQNRRSGYSAEQIARRRYCTEQIARGFAQQYWGQVAKPWSHTDDWVRYALSEFNACLLFHLSDKAQVQAVYQRNANTWFQALEQSKGMGSLAMAYRLNPWLFKARGNYQPEEMMRIRGAFLFYKVHQKLGDEKTMQLLVDALSQSSYQPMASARFSELLKKLGNAEIQELFDRGLWDTVPSNPAP